MDKPNILLVILDSVRARNTSLHGHGNRTTPFLEEFSEHSVVYKQARAPSIHSVSSHASLFTGHHVPEHGVTKHESKLDPTSTIWHELATEHGYDTGLFSPNVVVTVSSNLADSFQTVDGPRQDPGHRLFKEGIGPGDIEGHQTKQEYLSRCLNSSAPLKSIVNGLYFQYYDGIRGKNIDETATEYVDSFLEWSNSRSEPWAACLNLMDAHYPYEPTEEFDLWGGAELQALHDGLSAPPSREIATGGDWWKLRAIESLYDGCIRRLDAAVESLISALRDQDELDKTLLVITSDHGEGFGEWSGINPRVRVADHSWGLHEVQTHVPLIVNRPNKTDGRVEDRIASLIRFPDVVIEELGGETGSFAVDEYALATTHRLEHPERVLPTECPDRQQYAGPWRAIYQQDGENVRKVADQRSNNQSLLIRNAQVSYPDGIADMSMINNIYDNLTDAGVKESVQTEDSVSDTIEQQLEGLGYLR